MKFLLSLALCIPHPLRFAYSHSFVPNLLSLAFCHSPSAFPVTILQHFYVTSLDLYMATEEGLSLEWTFGMIKHEGSILSPTFFLVVMDKLLQQLSEENCGVYICGLYLGCAAHADDVSAITTSTTLEVPFFFSKWSSQ